MVRVPALNGQAYAEFALALPVILLLSAALVLALLWGISGARADVEAFFGARALQAGAQPAEVVREEGAHPRLTAGRLWLELPGPQLLGVEFRGLQAGRVEGRRWQFFGGRPE